MLFKFQICNWVKKKKSSTILYSILRRYWNRMETLSATTCEIYVRMYSISVMGLTISYQRLTTIGNHYVLNMRIYKKVWQKNNIKYMVRLCMKAVNDGRGKVYFLYEHGGTCKIFMWRRLGSALNSRGEIILTVALSSIASLLLHTDRKNCTFKV